MPEPSALPPLPRLYREHFDAVWATLRRLGVPPGSLEDAVHDVFMVVHRQRERFEGRSTARTWLLGIARRVAHRYRRTHARTQRRHLALASVIPPAPDPDDDIARQEGWRALQGFLDELDEDKRAAFVLGELERLNRQELGVALGVSPNTAWSRLRAARARFQDRFSEASTPPVLAAGRRAEPAPTASRERVWLVLAGGLRDAAAPAASVGSVWSVKAVVVTLGLATAGLGAVAAVAPGARGTAPAAPHDGSSKRAHGDGAGERARAPRDGAAMAEAAEPTAATTVARPPVEAARPSPSLDARAAPTSPTRPGPAAATTAARSPTTGDAPPRATSSAAPPVDAPATPDAIAAETALMLKARAALDEGRPRDALAALDEHRRRFAGGALAEERDATHVLARCALGQRDAALREARELVAAHPRSAYLAALADSCAASVTNPARAGDSPR